MHRIENRHKTSRSRRKALRRKTTSEKKEREEGTENSGRVKGLLMNFPNSAIENWYSMNDGAKWRIECKVGGRNEGIHEGRNKKRPGELEKYEYK